MSTLLKSPRQIRTLADVTRNLGKVSVRDLADLLHDLGDIPPERVWLTPPPGTATEKDVIEAEAKYNRLCELVDGTLVEKAMGYREGREAFVLGLFFEEYADQKNDFGLVCGADGTMRIMPSLVRIPDVSLVFWDRLPGRELPTEPIPDLVPNVAIEVLSGSNTPGEMKRKLREYFEAGVQQVWLVDGEARTFEIFTSPRKSQVFSGKQTIKGGRLLPGFELSVEAFFNRVRRKK
jgi:Uma2 family endonuclease